MLIGTAGYGVYTVALTSLGDRFSGIELVNGASSFGIVWGFGALFGSIAGGWTMLGFGPHGLPLMLALTYALLTLGVVRRELGRRRART